MEWDTYSHFFEVSVKWFIYVILYFYTTALIYQHKIQYIWIAEKERSFVIQTTCLTQSWFFTWHEYPKEKKKNAIVREEKEVARKKKHLFFLKKKKDSHGIFFSRRPLDKCFVFFSFDIFIYRTFYNPCSIHQSRLFCKSKDERI
jgi:hypothetical protein